MQPTLLYDHVVLSKVYKTMSGTTVLLIVLVIAIVLICPSVVFTNDFFPTRHLEEEKSRTPHPFNKNASLFCSSSTHSRSYAAAAAAGKETVINYYRYVLYSSSILFTGEKKKKKKTGKNTLYCMNSPARRGSSLQLCRWTPRVPPAA